MSNDDIDAALERLLHSAVGGYLSLPAIRIELLAAEQRGAAAAEARLAPEPYGCGTHGLAVCEPCAYDRGHADGLAAARDLNQPAPTPSATAQRAKALANRGNDPSAMSWRDVTAWAMDVRDFLRELAKPTE